LSEMRKILFLLVRLVLRGRLRSDTTERARRAASFALVVALVLARGIPFAEAAATNADDRGQPPNAQLRSPPAPSRIVSLAPNITEIIADLGLARRLAGVTRFCDFPPEVAGLPRVGGLIDPDIERIVSLRPDLVVMLKSASQRTEKNLEKAGLSVASYRIETIADLLAAYAELGRRLGVEAVSSERVKAMDAAFRRSPAGTARKRPPRGRIVFVISRTPGSFKTILTAGAGTYFEDLSRAIPLAGLALPTNGYVTVSLEAILKARPDIIAEVVADDDRSDASKRVREWDSFWKGDVSAPRIIVLKGNHFLRPGPRLVRALTELRAALSPSQSAPPP
jgi:iron complex transport system substrate-binding protein